MRFGAMVGLERGAIHAGLAARRAHCHRDLHRRGACPALRIGRFRCAQPILRSVDHPASAQYSAPNAATITVEIKSPTTNSLTDSQYDNVRSAPVRRE